MAYATIPAGSTGDAWTSAQTAFLQGAISQLTRFQSLKIGRSEVGGAAASTNDGATEGGARTATNVTTTYFGASIFQTCKTGYWGISVRCKFLATSVAQGFVVGIANAADTHDAVFGAYHSVSTTNYSLILTGTTSTNDDSGMTNDLGWHTFALTGDTANVRLYIDGTLKVTRAIGTNVVDEPYYPYMYNTVSGKAFCSDFLYGYVAP